MSSLSRSPQRNDGMLDRGEKQRLTSVMSIPDLIKHMSKERAQAR